MREHSFVIHESAASLVRELFSDVAGIQTDSLAAGRSQDSVLRQVRKRGRWAFVDVPSDQTQECVVHVWFKTGTDTLEVAKMLSHELGHISDGGPRRGITHSEEEDRADEYARVTYETITLLKQLRLI